jgi:RimJ/RimL family protein N-acetyltransferase
MIEGPNIRLRPIELHDLEPLALLVNDQANFEGGLRYSLWPRAELIAGFQRNNLIEPERFTLAVEEIETREVVGTGHVYPAHPFFKIPEIGLYIYPPDKRRQGLGFEATVLLGSLLFQTRPVPKVQMVTNSQNTFLIEALVRFGGEVEATLRQVAFHAGRYHDYVVISFFREGWEVLKDREELRPFLAIPRGSSGRR